MKRIVNVKASKGNIFVKNKEHVWLLCSRVRTWVSVEEAAVILRVSSATVYELMKTDMNFPFRVIGRKRHVDVTALPEWWQKNTQKAKRERISISTAEGLLESIATLRAKQ